MGTNIPDRINPLYLAVVLSSMLILPLISTLIESLTAAAVPPSILALIAKWFTFWAVGIRLFTAALRQIIRPAFTAENIFHIKDPESHIIVRELGFANLSISLLALLSLLLPSWRIPAACVGAVFFGIAGIQHIRKRPVSGNEWVALVSDLYIAILLTVCLIGIYI